MERTNNLKERNFGLAIIFVFFVGFIGHILPLTLKIMQNITPYILFAGAGIIYFYAETKQKDKFIKWFLGVVLLTFVAEVIGTKTGVIFGRYSYSNILGFRLMDVPLVIGFNWVTIILGAILVSVKFIKNIKYIPLVAAIITVLFDLLLEPVATKLFYWSWFNNVIPIKNFITWFVLSYVASDIFIRLEIKIKSDLPIYYLFAQVLFLLLLFFFY